MKKIVYTLSFLTVFAVAAKAQTKAAPQQQEPKKESLQTGDKKYPGPSQPATSSQPAPAPEAQPAAPKTRMAINEKGVPVSKTAEAKTKKEPQPAAGSPGQPAATTTEKH
jgi:hypothetical protein